MGIGMLASQALHLAAALVFGYLVFLGYRDIRRRSTVLGATVALAILIRIFLGVSLFSISYLELPLARSLQLPGGFWTLAIDATGYFQYAAHAVDTTHSTYTANSTNTANSTYTPRFRQSILINLPRAVAIIPTVAIGIKIIPVVIVLPT